MVSEHSFGAPSDVVFYMEENHPMKNMGFISNDNSNNSNLVIDNNNNYCDISSSSKVRKPYTITKSRESWTDEEHDKFLEALQLFDRDWKKIEAFVGSKTVIQIRSHAQKYFLKVQKSGTGEHVPPPRPKRKAAHPYPQKASKNALVTPQFSLPVQSSGSVLEAGYIFGPDSMSLPGPICNSNFWAGNSISPANASNVTQDEARLTRPVVTPNCCSSSSNGSAQRTWPTGNVNDQIMATLSGPKRVMPDFAEVYHFIGSVFDPNAHGHLQKLKNMDPINVETAMLLMKNLAANLSSPEFEDHRKMLCSYDADAEKRSCAFHHSPKLENAIPLV